MAALVRPSKRFAARGARTAVLGLGLALCAAFAFAPQDAERTSASGRDAGCLACHSGIESMHPEAQLACVDCHGGDGAATTKREAHGRRRAVDAGDERVAPQTEDLGARRFANPMDLRVASLVCGPCHESQVERVHTGLHSTTAGHLSDGYYENGLNAKKGSTYAVFNTPAHMADAGEVGSLFQVPPFRDIGKRDALSTHYADLARKECMQCHLWSRGRAVRGRVGFDGDYRGEGCAACHVAYATDGLSASADQSAIHTEPGHPRTHEMTRAPTTATCTSCHYGDASIGLNFRGLSQLPPGAPGGPDIPGTTDALLNRQFYLNDPKLCPPDVHHERGMHCIDCHTANDVMGDGRLHGSMEHAVEISCSDCHGTFTEPATLRTQRGTPLAHLRRRDGQVVLTSKVDGREHVVPQLVDVLDPTRASYDADAAKAMNGSHADLECYLCHSAWNPNFMGFHFDRNESLTQLDLLSGLRTKGRVTTQEKVFSTWKSFYAGLNEAGRFAPYLTGFSTMGTVRDGAGEVLVDQALPVTAAGLSGLTQIHHQMHTVRKTARACVECHRSSGTWGLGSVNFRLGRQLAFVADRRGLEVVALDRSQLSASVPLAKLPLPDIVDLELDCDALQGFARRVFVAEGHRGVHVIDVSDPTQPRRAHFVATIQPKGLALAGRHLYVADGAGGVRVFEVSSDGELNLVAVLPTFDARAVHVQWPYLYVADGPGGVLVVDIRRPAAPKAVGGARLYEQGGGEDAASHVSVLFQYSRPRAKDGRVLDRRTQARVLLAVLDEERGLCLYDATEPSRLERLLPRVDQESRARRVELSYRGLLLASHVDVAETQGGSPTRECDFAYVLVETDAGNVRQSRIQVLDVSDPARARGVASVQSGQATEMLALGSFYNAPFLQTVLFAPASDGVFATDATISAEPKSLGALAALRTAFVVALEEFPLDRMLDEDGRALKDVSHVGSRWLELPEIERLLLVPGEILGTIEAGSTRPDIPGETARLHFARFDADRSGVIDGQELVQAGARFDGNGDGRILLAELAGLAGLEATVHTEVAGAGEARFLETRVDRDGDLSRLLDGTSPFDFDADRNRKLDRDEVSRAVFAALDLDRDRGLELDELSRAPGDLRQLRYRGPWARARFDALDDNRDGRLQIREFAVADEDFLAMDLDRDGFVALGAPANPWWERRGFVGARSEWPTRRVAFVALSPLVSSEDVWKAFDANGNGQLSVREMRARPDLYRELDADGDELVDEGEVARRVAIVSNQGVDVCPDGFVDRWDLDGDGKVEEHELPATARIALQRRSR